MYALSLRLSDELGEQLVAFSDQSGIPRNTIIRKALEGYLDAVEEDRPVKAVKVPQLQQQVDRRLAQRAPRASKASKRVT